MRREEEISVSEGGEREIERDEMEEIWRARKKKMIFQIFKGNSVFSRFLISLTNGVKWQGSERRIFKV